MPENRLQFWISFLPEQERILRPTGIHLFGLRYWSPALSADVGRTQRRLLVKFDPRDMSRVFVRRSSGNFVEARYANLILASITLREALMARRTLREKGRREVDSCAVVRTSLEQRKMIEKAISRTTAARRAKTQPRRSTVDRETGMLRSIDSSKPVPFVEDTE